MATTTRDASKAFGCLAATYPDGKQALFMNRDGSGFAYYPTGRVAACITAVSAYQTASYFYENDARKTLIASFDEHVSGFALSSSGRRTRNTPGHKFNGEKLVLTKTGGLLTDVRGNLRTEWKWDPNAQDAGAPPREPVTIQLNEYLAVRFASKGDIGVQFRAPSDDLEHTFQCGEQLRRKTTYMEGAKRSTLIKGKIDVEVETPTLTERFRIENAEQQKGRLAVSSKDMGNETVSRIMAGMEDLTGAYHQRIVDGDFVKTYCDPSCKTDALAATVSEVPRITRTGAEVRQAVKRWCAGVVEGRGASRGVERRVRVVWCGCAWC